MKKALKGAAVAAGGVVGLEVSGRVSVPLVGRAFAAVGLAGKIPALADRIITNLIHVGHVVGGLAAGSYLAKKIG